jgi:hypothetical protein
MITNMSDNTTDFGAIEAQTTNTTDETTFADFGGEERSNRADPEPRLETETATKFGVDDRETAESIDTGTQAEIADDAEDGQLDLAGNVAEQGPAWADSRGDEDTRYLGDVYGPTMKQPIPAVERCRYDHWATPIDERELAGTPVTPHDMDCWTVELETGIHKADLVSPNGNSTEDREHRAATGERRRTPDFIENPEDFADGTSPTDTTAEPVERAEYCAHPTTTARTCTDQYGTEHTKHICDDCNFTVAKHSGTDSGHCDHCGDAEATEGGR